MNRLFPKFVAAQLAVECSVLLAVGFMTLGSLILVIPADAASARSASGSIAGVVRDSSGTPQIGIAVELVKTDSTLVSRVFTDQKGVYSIASVLPGQYALKAVGESFLPLVKQNLRVRTNTIVNLTLNTLYDLMQWAPQPQRPRAEGQDDWAWTLRSAASRPLLRWQDDGSPILIWNGGPETTRTAQVETHRDPYKRRMRVLASAGGKQFGSGPEKVSYAMVQSTSPRRRVAFSSDLSGGEAPGLNGVMDAMLGFRQEMANSGLGSSSVQTLAAVISDPEAGAGPNQGLQAASLRSWESLEILNSLEAEAGSDQVIGRLGNGSTVVAALPFASLTLHRGQGALEYRMASAHSSNAGNDAGGSADMAAGTWLPILSERQGELVLEHGLHQELGWSTSAGPAEMQLVIYADNIENPMLEGSGRLTAGDDAGQSVLLDRASSLIRAAGPNYSTTGMLASIESRLPGNNHIKLSYASGDALVMHANALPQDIQVILNGAVARRAQMYSLAVSGNAEGTGTRWRASYRWQPDSTVTEVAPFAVDASEPYLNVYVRQSIWTNHQGGGVEAQVDLRNLLAEGYQPFLTSDGSHIYFAQAQRSVRGGLAFTF